MSDTPESGSDGAGIKDKEDDYHIVPFTIVSLLFYSVFFFFLFLTKPYRRYLHFIRRAPTHGGRMPRWRTFSYWLPTSLVFWKINKPRCTQPSKSQDYKQVYSDWCQEFEKYKSDLQAWESRQTTHNNIVNEPQRTTAAPPTAPTN